MRLVLFIAVVALVVDALYFSGAYTQAAFRQLTVAVSELETRIRGGTDAPDPEPTGSVRPPDAARPIDA